MGMPKERTFLSFKVESVVMHPITLGIIFTGIILCSIFDGAFEVFFGLASTLLFLLAFSRLHVEYAYAAILKWRDKGYWEEHHPSYDVYVNKTKLRIGIEIVCLVIIFYFIGINDYQGEYLDWLRIPVLLIFADWLIVGFRRFIQNKI